MPEAANAIEKRLRDGEYLGEFAVDFMAALQRFAARIFWQQAGTFRSGPVNEIDAPQTR